MVLPQASLGRNGPQVDRLGLGLMGLSVYYGTVKSDAERLAFLDEAFALGVRYWDTADMYGDSEDLLGKWFKANPEKRKDLFLATKFANRTLPDGSRAIDSSPEYAREACVTSLNRLGLDSVDLYYCHRLDRKTPIEKTIVAMKELKEQGRFKYLGLSECSADSLRRAHAVHPITAVQIEYSPFSLDTETEQINLLKTCRELGVATVAYSPLGRGLITGTLHSPDDFEDGDFRKLAPRFSKENFPKNLKLVEIIGQLADKKDVTPSQLALAWLLKQGQDVFPIPGTTRIDRLKENIKAAQVNLSDEDERVIRRACEAAEVSGSRYPPSFLAACYADSPPL